MRPLKLRLKGINSYRTEQEIDFDTLTSQGLFGIFGPTGSGKSSILDAMTLALYAKLPRSTKNYIHMGEKTASVSFLFSITTDCTRKYLVERSFRYHNKEDGSSARNTTARLIRYENGGETVLADKSKEVTAECEKLLGLGSEDFMRTVVLPQGQFSEFLQLKNAERRGMLQRIFHLEEYGIALTQKISRAKQSQENKLSYLEGQRTIYENVTPDAMEELKKARETLCREKETLAEKTAALQKSFADADERLKLEQEFAPVQERFLADEKQRPEIQKKEAELALAEKANQLRPLCEQADKADKALRAATGEATLANETYVRINEQHKALQAKLATALAQWEKEMPILEERQRLLEQNEKTAALLRSQTAQQSTLKKAILKLEKELAALEAQQNTLASEETSLRESIDFKQRELEQKSLPVTKKRQLADGHILEKTYRERCVSYKENLLSLKESKEKLAESQRDFDEKKETLANTYAHLLSGLAALDEKRAAAKDALEKLAVKKAENEQSQKDWEQEHMAELLRASLKDGDICPVCGSVHHADNREIAPHASRERLEREHAALEREEKKTEEFLSELEKKHSLLEHQRDNALQQVPDLKDITPFDIEQLKTEQVLSAAELTRIFPQLLANYAALTGELKTQKEQFAARKEALEREHAALMQDAAQITALREQAGIHDFTEAHEAFQREEEAAAKTEASLKKERKAFDELTPKKEALSGQISEKKSQLALKQGSLTSCEQLLVEHRSLLAEEFSLETDFPKLLEALKEKRQQLATEKKQSQTAHEKSFADLQEKKEALSVSENTLANAKKRQEEAESLLLAQKESLGFAPEEILDAYYLPAEELKSQKDAIKAYHESAAKTADRHSRLSAKLEGRHITEEEWMAAKDAHADVKDRLADLSSELTLKENAIITLKEQLTKKATLEKAWKQESHRKDLILELEKLFKGNAFIEYVAKERLAYIAREASAILTDISSGGYALEINEASEFVIRDNKNGGLLRPADTLSGGEVFITSLSLALALSSSIQLNGVAPLEFFFLDEGFGSLDDALLETVMTSLERLQNKKRSIGIISHVEAIRSRVPIKLIVTPSDMAQDGSTIRMERS